MVLNREVGNSPRKENALNDNGFRPLFSHLSEGGLYLVRAAYHGDRGGSDAGRSASEMDLRQERPSEARVRVDETRHTAKRRQRVPQQFDALSCRLGGHIGEA